MVIKTLSCLSQLLLGLVFLCPAHAANTTTPLSETAPALTSTDQAQASVGQQAPGKSPATFDPEKYPSDWSFEFVKEPVFNASILKVEAGQAHKDTVILIHGLGQAGFEDWLNQIEALAQHYHVLTLDLPGFGYSEKPPGRYSPTHYGETINWLANRYGKNRIHVVGHSMGGTIAIRYAYNHPEKVASVTLIDAAGILERTAFIKHSAMIPFKTHHVNGWLRRFSGTLQDLADSVMERTARDLPTQILLRSDQAWNLLLSDLPNTNAAIAMIEENFNEALRRFPHPTSVIWGRQDPIAPLRTGYLLAHVMPRASLHIIDDAEHVPMKSHPAEINKRLLAHFENPKALIVASDSLAAPVQVATENRQTLPNLVCRHQSGLTYSGRYNKVVMEHCSDISLIDFQAHSVELNESVVSMRNVTINAEDTALKAVESVIKLTNGLFRGKIGIYASGSRLDLAGLDIEASDDGIYSSGKSRVFLSICSVQSAQYQGYAHGAFVLTRRSIDTLLENTLFTRY